MAKLKLRMKVMQWPFCGPWLRILGANNRIMFTSESYCSVSNANRAARRFSEATGIPVEERSKA